MAQKRKDEPPSIKTTNKVCLVVDSGAASLLFDRMLQGVRMARKRIERERKQGKQNEQAA